jgi:hypothetical protein
VILVRPEDFMVAELIKSATASPVRWLIITPSSVPDEGDRDGL